MVKKSNAHHSNASSYVLLGFPNYFNGITVFMSNTIRLSEK